jgi:hypothetical protein
MDNAAVAGARLRDSHYIVEPRVARVTRLELWRRSEVIAASPRWIVWLLQIERIIPVLRRGMKTAVPMQVEERAVVRRKAEAHVEMRRAVRPDADPIRAGIGHDRTFEARPFERAAFHQEDNAMPFWTRTNVERWKVELDTCLEQKLGLNLAY